MNAAPPPTSRSVRKLLRTVGTLTRGSRGDGKPVAYQPRGIELFYWRSAKGVNFGDYLSSVIVNKMAALEDCFLDEDRATPARLLAIGSILHFARNGDVVWGSGVNGKVPVERHTFQHLDVRAVRGPLTRDFLVRRGTEVPEIYGDPAILTADLLSRRFARPDKPTTPVAFVPNLHDLPSMEAWENVISPLDHWSSVVERISGAGHIISSSLHGLVVADAFGIPCTYLRLSEEENLFKYEDYCLGVGRSNLRVTQSKEEALRASPLDPIAFDSGKLKAAFPYDLWRR